MGGGGGGCSNYDIMKPAQEKVKLSFSISFPLIGRWLEDDSLIFRWIFNSFIFNHEQDASYFDHNHFNLEHFSIGQDKVLENRDATYHSIIFQENSVK